MLSVGGVEALKDDCRDARSGRFLETLWQDLRYGTRGLLKNRAFSLAAILTLALGIGANTAIFTLVNAVLLKDLPVVDPQSLVRLGDSDQCCVNRGAEEDGN